MERAHCEVVSVTEEKSGEERHKPHEFPKHQKCTVKVVISFGSDLPPIMLSRANLDETRCEYCVIDFCVAVQTTIAMKSCLD